MAKDLIRVGKRFQRSVNLSSDFQQPSAVRDFVVSPLAWETLERITHGLATADGSKAWALVGPYGSGKSSFAAFFINLISPDTRGSAFRKIKRSWPQEAGALIAALKRSGPGLLPVPIVGERAPLAQLLLRGVNTAAENHWTSRGRRPRILESLQKALTDFERGKEVKDSEVVKIILGVAEAVTAKSSPGSGLCLILDEFGKTLEWAALHPAETDLYLLQLLAEAANRPGDSSFLLMTIQHQGLEAYAGRLSAQQQREWEKVAGRFEAVPYLESPRHLTRLVAEAIEVKATLPQCRSLREHGKAVKALRTLGAGELPVEDLLACYPLQPAAALLLGPLFRLDLGQNERSLFSFLSSREPRGFQEFLNQWNQDPAGTELYGLPDLYDYVLANTRALLSTGPDSRVWRTAEEAIHRLPKSAGRAEEQLIKAVALLSLVGQSVGLTASANTLAASLGLSKKQAESAISSLEKASIILFRQFKASYQLWDGSDLDVGKLLKEGRTRVLERGNLAGQITSVYDLPPFLAARHYLETGTLRSLECKFLSGTDYHFLESYQGQADGLIAIVLPERTTVTQEALEGIPLGQKPILSLHLHTDSPLTEAVLGYLGAKEALACSAELENDPIARRALEDLRLAAWDKLHEQLTRAFHGKASGHWHLNGAPRPNTKNLSELATEGLADAFFSTPIIHNELLNRSHLSSAAASARRELLERLLTKATEERLGMKGFPPEYSMYLSVVDGTGIHKPNRGGGQHPGLCKPSRQSPLFGIWKSLDDKFKSQSGQRISLADVYEEFSKPPFGVREGLLPVILFAYLLVHQSEAFLYEDGSFIPAIERDHVQRFLSRPQTFEIQKLAQGSKTKAALEAAAIALHLAPEEARLLSIVKALIQTAADLSPFARTTQRISPGARKVRAALLSARDPIHLLQVAIPSALGIEQTGKAMKESMSGALEAALAELRSSDTKLLEEIRLLVLQAFGRGSFSKMDFQTLSERANAIDLEAFPVQPLARLVLIFAAVDGPSPSAEWFRQIGLALVGKPVPQWRDEDIPLFRSVLFEAARQFAAAEAGSTDMAKLDSLVAEGGQLTSIAWLTSQGGYDTAVAHITPDLRDSVAKAMPALEATAAKYSLSLTELLAAALVTDEKPNPPQSPEEAFSVEV